MAADNRECENYGDRQSMSIGGPSTDQVGLWVRFPVGAGSSHTNTLKMGMVSTCMDEVGTTNHNWSAWCQYNVTGSVSM